MAVGSKTGGGGRHKVYSWRGAVRVAEVVVVLLLTGAAAGCTSTSTGAARSDAPRNMARVIADHKGEWTKGTLASAAAASAHEEDLVTVIPKADGSGGVLIFQIGGHLKGDRAPSRTGSGHSGHATGYADSRVRCVKVTVTGHEFTTEHYHRASLTGIPSCAD
jgi:hypothetical protein